jgi:hypothetical protein
VSWFFKSKQVNLAILVASFLVGFVPYFLEMPQVDSFANTLTMVSAVVGQFAIAISIYSQYRRSLRFIGERRKGWVYNIYLLLLMSVMIVMGFVWGEHHASYMWLVNSIVAPCSSVVYGILAFYMFSAGARAFRARSLKATFLIIAGIIVLLYQAPLTGAYFPGISPYATFLTETVGMSLNRMFNIAIITGAIMLNVRMLTGRELAFMGFIGEEAS